MQDRWFPSADDKAIVTGRFVDIEVVDAAKSAEEQQTVWKTVPMLQSKALGSHDVSSIRVKPFNKAGLIARFPEAWAFYERHRGEPPSQDPIITIPGDVDGTPLHKGDFLGVSQINKLATLGFTTLEQVAAMSDTACQNVGHGAMTWRKRAAEFLART